MKFRSWESKKLMKKLKSYVPVFPTREPITSYIVSQPKQMKWRIIPPWIQFSGFCTIHLLFQPKTKKLFITSVNINRYRCSLHRRTYLQGNRSWTGNYKKIHFKCLQHLALPSGKQKKTFIEQAKQEYATFNNGLYASIKKTKVCHKQCELSLHSILF